MRQNRPRRLLALALSLAMTASLAVTGAGAAGTEDTGRQPFLSSNYYRTNGFTNGGGEISSPQMGFVVLSFLAPNAVGGFTRVEAYNRADATSPWEGHDYHLTVEEYDADFTFLSRKALPVELPKFLGCVIADDGIYIASGTESNGKELPNAEVMRIVKYSRDCQQRLLSRSVTLENTNYDAPFIRVNASNTSNFDMQLTEDGHLLIHTSQTQMADENGLNHQSNVTFDFNASDLSSNRFSAGIGYVSHSWYQYIRDDGENLVLADVGDGYPRAVAVTKVPKAYLNGVMDGKSQPVTVNAMDIQGQYEQGPSTGNPLYDAWLSANNNTCVTLGGLEASASSYLTIGTTIDQDQFKKAEALAVEDTKLFVTVTDKDTMETEIKFLENYPDDGDTHITLPHLLPLGGDRFLAMWADWFMNNHHNREFTAKCAILDGKGELVDNITTLPADLSDCRPVVQDGVVTWYVTKEGSAPIFYQLDTKDMSLVSRDTWRPYLPKGPVVTGDQSHFQYDTARSASFSDVEANLWYTESVTRACQMGLMNGASATTFNPQGTVTVAEAVAMAARIRSIYTTGKAEFTQGSPWYQVYMDYCKENDILTWDIGDPAGQISRAQYVQLLDAAVPPNALFWRDEVRVGNIADVDLEAPYAGAVYRFYRSGITGGGLKNLFMPDNTITRAEVAAIASRIADPKVTVWNVLSNENNFYSISPDETFPFDYPPVQGWESTPEDQQEPSDDPNKDPSGSNIGQLDYANQGGIQRERLPAGTERPADYQYDDSVLPEGSPSGQLTCGTIHRRRESYDGQHFTEYVDVPNPLYDGTPGRNYMQATYTLYAPARNHWAQLSHPDGADARNPKTISLTVESAARIGTDSFIKLDAYYSDGEGEVQDSRWASACCGLLDISGIAVAQGENGAGQVTGLKPNAWYCVTKLHWFSESSFTPVSAFYQADGSGVIQIDNTVDDDLYLQLLDDNGVTAPTLVR